MEQNQNFPFHKAEWSSQITTQNTNYKTHTGPLILIRHSLKYKTAGSQKTSYKDTIFQIQVLTNRVNGISQVFKDFKERKGSQVERRVEGEGMKWWPYKSFLPPADVQVLHDFSQGLQKGKMGTQPY